METIRLTDQQSLRIAELPDDYLVVGVDRRAPLVRKPNGQIVRIQQNGRLSAATIAAKRRLADRRAPVRRDFLVSGSRSVAGPSPRPERTLPIRPASRRQLAEQVSASRWTDSLASEPRSPGISPLAVRLPSTNE
jgi:hypothetical protein